MNYTDDQITKLKEQREMYSKYIESIDKQIESVENAIQEHPDIQKLIGKCYMDRYEGNMVYVVIAPALTHDTKEPIPDKVKISHHTIREDDSQLYIYKGEYHLDTEGVLDDYEITEEQMERIIKYWIDLSNRGGRKIKDVIKTFKEEMLRYSNSIGKPTN